MEFFIGLLLSILTFFFGGNAAEAPQPPPTNTHTTAEVVRVVDGDTIVVLIAGEEEKVRYIGIDTPEPYRDGDPACFSLEASLKNQELVQGKMVRLETDQENTDKYGRLLRYVYTDELFVNAELVRGGYAKSLTIKPNTAHSDQFIALEQTAREQNTGLWGVCQ